MCKSLLLFLCLGASLFASPVTYQVNVNTATLSGTTGNVDFQYNSGPDTTDPSFITINFFTPAGQLSGVPQTIGSVTGTLPGPVIITNTPGLNDYFQGITFTNAITFSVTFDGPTPTGTAIGGSAFAFTLYADDGFTPLLANFPDTGANVQAFVAPNGSIDFPTPEPASFALLGLGFAAIAIRLRNRSYGRKA
jgi:hypothetical protein